MFRKTKCCSSTGRLVYRGKKTRAKLYISIKVNGNDRQCLKTKSSYTPSFNPRNQISKYKKT